MLCSIAYRLARATASACSGDNFGGADCEPKISRLAPIPVSNMTSWRKVLFCIELLSNAIPGVKGPV